MGFASETRGRSQPVIPMAGMIDILFLLLVFVVSTYSLRAQETQISVDLSVMENGEVPSGQALVIYITLTKDDRIYLGQREIEPDALLDELSGLFDFSPNQPVVVRSDGDVSVRREHWAMAQATKAGLTDVRIASVEEE